MKNYGLVETVQEVTAYITGANTKVPWIPYQENGDWEKYLPKYEPQAETFETNGCTVWGTQNQIETFHKAIYGTEPNYSENFTFLLTPVNPNVGADPQKVYDCIREDGLVDHNELRIPRTLADFLDLSRLTGSILAKGQNWLLHYDLLHEWLWSGYQMPPNGLELMKDALKTSPLGIQVSAWTQKNGKYIDGGKKNNHWCIAYRIDKDGIHAFDSYDHSKKVLSLDHKIGRAKRIWLGHSKIRSLKKHKTLLEQILTRLLMKPDLLDVCESHLGKDASPNDLAPDELACAETVTTLLKKIYPETPILTGTWTLYDYLNNPKNGWIKVTEPTEECIIISPTGTGKKGAVGHVGIVGAGGVIMSNDSGVTFKSNKGKFLKNYTLATWQKRYAQQLGFPVLFYRRK